MIMPESAQAVGLCSTCNNSPSCFHRARRGPALFCELFDDYVAMSDGNAIRTATEMHTANESQSKYAGLCMNCEHRRACGYPKPAGGVWHCENYE